MGAGSKSMKPWCGWALVASVLLLVGCGGDRGIADAKVAASEAPRQPTMRALAAPLAGGGAVAPHQAPTVVHLEQLSAKRVDRTRFDYVFALHVKGAGQHIQDAVFTATSSATGTQVIDGVARHASLNAERHVVLADTITVRHDRSQPFDVSKLVFSFEGRFVDTVAPAGDLQIGAVTLYVAGGRPGHEGSFKSTDSDPQAGQQVQLNAQINGVASSVRYDLLDTAGQVVQSGALTRLWPQRDDHTAPLVVPTHPFAIRVAALAASGATVSWISEPYTPRTLSAAWVSKNGAAFRYGARLDSVLHLSAAPAAQAVEVRLLLPPGFTADRVLWQVPAGSPPLRLPVLVQTPVAGHAGTFYDVMVAVTAGTKVPAAYFLAPLVGW